MIEGVADQRLGSRIVGGAIYARKGHASESAFRVGAAMLVSAYMSEAESDRRPGGRRGAWMNDFEFGCISVNAERDFY